MDCNVGKQCFLYEIFPWNSWNKQNNSYVQKGKSNDVNKYHPISIILSLAKIFEKLLFSRINQFLTKYKLSNPHPLSFRNKRSTIDTVLVVTEIMSTYIRKQLQQWTLVYLTKAFDTVEHNILLVKGENYGLRGVIGNLLRSYLENKSKVLTWTDKNYR